MRPDQMEPPMTPARMRDLAKAELQRRDYRILKAVASLVASPEWCEWRDKLCAIVNSPEGHIELPPEPPFGKPAAQARAEPSPPPLPDLSKLEAIQHTLQSRPDTPEGGYEYGAGEEVITEVEPEPGGIGADPRPRLIASDWLKGQMKSGESLGAARNRLLTEYNILLNKNVTASFANDAERIRFRDLTANMTDFSKG